MTSNVKSLVYKMNIVVDCKDAGVLAEFYSKLLGWELTHQRANGWAAITSPSGMVMAFQEIEEYQHLYGLGKKVSRDKCFILISMWKIWRRLWLMPFSWEHGRRMNSTSGLHERCLIRQDIPSALIRKRLNNAQNSY